MIILHGRGSMDPVRDFAWLQATMEEAPVTASMGPMAAVLRLLNSRHPLPDGVSEAEIQRLLKGLKGLCITLKDLSDQVDEPSFTAKCWMKEVRELCFDTQDYLDEVPSASSGGDAAASSSTTSRPRLSTVLWKHSKLNRHPKTKTQAARDFSELRARVVDASKRRRRLQLAQQTSKSLDGGQAGVSHHLTPRLPIQMLEDPMDDLVKLLAFDDKKETQLKVVSIFGFAGVGKTTAAKTLYGNHGWKFLCRAFLRVSRNPDMRSLFTSILTQIKASPPNGFPDVQDLIDTIRTHLQGKRYLIIIDDLWASSTWDIISCAFPHGDCGSRIITTTEIKDVALACCRPHLTHKYDLCPLKPEKSRKLFFSIVFGSGSCCPKDFQEISDMIVSKCGGLPLVTANIAGLLASKTNHANIASMLVSERNDVVGQWKQLHDCLPCSMMTNPTYDGMKEFIKLMYNALPPYLKTCLLYLSMYPEGHIMKKDDLVKQWVVEDFIGSEQTAGVYFDDLVNRGMIQPVNTNCIGEVLSGTVHHMVLDLIRHKSMLENFIVIVGSLPSTAGLSDKVRRLSVQLGGAKFAHVPTGLKISQVRSLAFFGFSDGMHSIEKYRLLQVLILHIWADQDKDPFDLTIIGELFRLRYLNIQCNITVQLPDEIAGLQYLETLQVDAKLSAVPSDIVHLEKLLHLRLPSECILPDGFARLTSLRTLGYFDIDSNSKDNVMDLAKLANLEDLQLTCSMAHRAEEPENNEQLLCLILMKLSVLKSITLTPTAGCSPVHIPCIAVFPSLQRIKLSPHCCILFCIPQQLGGLRELCILKIAVRGLSKHDIDILKGLPLLAALTLYVQTAPPERIIIGEGGFPVLTYFKFMCAAVPSLYFLHGAMPNVQKLKLGFNLHKRQAYSLEAAGFHHLSGLMEISVKFGSRNADEFNREAVESALETTVTNHPNTLIVRVQFVDSIFGDEEYKSMAIEEKEDAALEKRREIQEGMKKSTGRSEEHVNRQVDNRYGTTDRLSTPMEHHAQPVSLGTGTMDQATGAMGCLLPKLVELLKDEYKLKNEVREGVKSIQKEMESMHAALRKVAEVPRDQLDEQVKLWAGEVRELSFNMEDVVDKFLVRVDDGSEPAANPKKLKQLTKKMAGLFTKGKARHEIADAIKSINKKVKEVADRRARYNVDNIVASIPTATPIDPRLGALYKDVTELVGITGTRDQEIMKLLSEGDDMSKKKLKIISVVGFGGLGKTTLVKTVYDKIKGDFDYKAFVPVGRNANAKEVFMDILHELDPQNDKGQLTMLNERQLIDKIQLRLENKRYLIVIDDIWDGNLWTVINWAFSNNSSLGSRLITTTRKVGVAELCCTSPNDSIYKMEPLSVDDSKRLFYRRLFSHESGCPLEFEEVSMDILKKCGGVPLAIITIASSLSSGQQVKPKDEWHILLKSIGRGLTEDPSVEEMLMILSFSYYDLPCHLKTCLLYLSMFPEDSKIMKDQLIWMWIAERFIQCETTQPSLFEIGENYFNELVNRSLLQPVYNYYGIVDGCHVHDSVLDLICLLSREENFVSVLNGSMSSQGNVRRLSLQKIIKEEHETTALESVSMLQVRSIATFEPAMGLMPRFSSFVVLRVLNLSGCSFDKDNLGELWSLVHLRYLGLSDTGLCELPEEVGKLQFLQVLDVSGNPGIEKLPSSVTKLRRLMCLLYTKRCNRLSNGIGNLTAMEELTSIHGDNLSIVKEMGNMKRLRKFKIQFEHLSLELEEAFVTSLGEMSNVQSVTIFIDGGCKKMDLLGEKWVPPRGLRELISDGERVCRFSKLPAWIRENPSRMSQLSDLYIGVEEVQQVDLGLLGRLPALHQLAMTSARQGPLLIDADGFRCLAIFCLYSKSPGQVVFQPGALPKAERVMLRTGLPVAKEEAAGNGGELFDTGIGNLPSLRSVNVVFCSSLLRQEAERARSALETALRAHPNRPTFYIAVKDDESDDDEWE